MIKLTIAKKLLATYLLMALLTIMIGAYALFSLQYLNDLAYSIVKKDFLIIYHTRQLIDNILAQERSEKKFIILRDPALEELFWERSKAVKDGITRLEKVDYPGIATFETVDFPGISKLLTRIRLLHEECDAIFRREVMLIKADQTEEAMRLSENTIKEKIEAATTLARDLQKKAEHDVEERMNRISSRGIKASSVITVLFLISLCGGIALALFITYNITRPLKKLKKATGFIADGNFDYDDLKISYKDEIGELAQRFRVMANRLKVLEQLNLDASPLTRLPGNIAIERQIERRLAAKKPFSLCHADLDNFKPFADKYGYAWASEVIKEVADILTGALRTSGQDNDFIGHIGGDDFIIVTEPERAEQVCQQVVAEFDQRILKFYEEEDKERGFIIGKDRRGHEQTFPLITISIGIVTDDGSRYASPLAMARAAADLKEHAKTYPVSNYVKQKDVHQH